jgi:hypothetical protein
MSCPKGGKVGIVGGVGLGLGKYCSKISSQLVSEDSKRTATPHVAREEGFSIELRK